MKTSIYVRRFADPQTTETCTLLQHAAQSSHIDEMYQLLYLAIAGAMLPGSTTRRCRDRFTSHTINCQPWAICGEKLLLLSDLQSAGPALAVPASVDAHPALPSLKRNRYTFSRAKQRRV